MNPTLLQSVFVLLLTVTLYVNGANVTETTRYWDCCKPSCAWNGKAKVTRPVESCAADGVTEVAIDTTSGCGGGGLAGKSYMCNNQQPWVVNSSLSFGFAAAFIVGGNESTVCCSCYELTFTDTAAKGLKFVVQILNTGDDPGLDKTKNHFDLQMPGGGVGQYNGCTTQWNLASADAWGAKYGGVATDAECAHLPSQLQAGCHWHFGWLKGASNPNAEIVHTQCPKSIVAKSKCHREDDGTVANNHYASM